MDPDLSRLQPVQRELLARWLPHAQVVADLSWRLTATRVLEVISHHDRFIVKAGGPGDGNIVRELRAHRQWLGPWVDTGRAPSLVAGDEDAKLLVTRYLPGALVEGTVAQDDPETYRQAGGVLADLHRQLSFVDEGWWNDKLRSRRAAPGATAPNRPRAREADPGRGIGVAQRGYASRAHSRGLAAS